MTSDSRLLALLLIAVLLAVAAVALSVIVSGSWLVGVAGAGIGAVLLAAAVKGGDRD